LDAQFAEAFLEFGIDINGLEPAEAAARIGRTTISQALVRALDEWAAMRKRAHGVDEFWKKLIEIARQADPDEWRNRFREALLLRNRLALEKLADTVRIRAVPPATVYLLGQTLRELGALDKAMAVLREAHPHHPDDFWLNDALGWFSMHAFDPPRYEDAVRYYTAAVALRPRNASTHLELALALSQDASRIQEAEEHHRQSLALFEKLAVNFPRDLLYVEQVGHGQRWLGGLLWRSGRL